MSEERDLLPPLDLLDPAPRAFAAAAARRALDFVWATGIGLEALDQALGSSPATATSSDAAAFAADLFLPDLVRRCMPVRAEGRDFVPNLPRFTAVVATPPADPAVVAHRRRIVRELAARHEVRAAVEKVYARVRDLRDRLGSSGGVRDRAAERLRRLDTLTALRDAVAALGGALATARSPLRELADLGDAVRGGAAFARLEELLAWESGASTVQLSVRVGADGAIRGVATLARDDRPSPAGGLALGRFLRRLMRALRGERWDEAEVVARLLDETFAPLADLTIALLRIGLDLEPYLGTLGMKDLAEGASLAVSLPSLSGVVGGDVRWEALWNPFLLAEASSAGRPTPVACDLAFDDGPPLVVITGPNSGGKTRLLQSIAIAVLLGQGGFFVPAAVARWPWVPSLFASIVQAPELDAPEGRLGTELLRIRDVFDHARPGCLVVIDELCSGTNPSEAEELVRFVVEQLAAVGALVVVTTHLLDVARHMAAVPPAPRLAFREVELGADQQPTFRFLPGVAASSLARRTAERLGVTREALAGVVAARLEDPAAALPEVPAELDEVLRS